ncbi:MAG: M48 family metalloprotease [Calditrichae bacterium]|nr:M48 family metalloprotease [Calditrichia bacterium]
MEQRKAKQYNRLRLLTSIGNITIDVIFWMVIIYSGLGSLLANICYQTIEQPLLQFYLFVIFLGGMSFAIHFPLGFYSGFILEHQFSLSVQSLTGWFIEKLKSIFIALLLGGIILTVFFILLTWYPSWWWIFVWLFLLIFSVILSRIAPLVIFPLFFKFKSLENQQLKERIQKFAQKWNLQISGVYQFNLSKNTKKANAAFTGIGKSKRIILGDTLLEKFDEDEIETIFAHEVGHYHHKHIIKGIILNSIISFIGLWLIYHIYTFILKISSYESYRLEALPYLAIIFLFYGLITGPIGNYISRKYEYQADNFAVSTTGKSDIYKNSLKKLADLNLADESPHPIIEFLFYSHPSIKHRIEKIAGVT